MPITIETKHFYKIQDTLSATPHAANNLFKDYAPPSSSTPLKLPTQNEPHARFREVKEQTSFDGWPAWTEIEIEQLQ